MKERNNNIPITSTILSEAIDNHIKSHIHIPIEGKDNQILSIENGKVQWINKDKPTDKYIVSGDIDIDSKNIIFTYNSGESISIGMSSIFDGISEKTNSEDFTVHSESKILHLPTSNDSNLILSTKRDKKGNVLPIWIAKSENTDKHVSKLQLSNNELILTFNDNTKQTTDISKLFNKITEDIKSSEDKHVSNYKHLPEKTGKKGQLLKSDGKNPYWVDESAAEVTPIDIETILTEIKSVNSKINFDLPENILTVKKELSSDIKEVQKSLDLGDANLSKYVEEKYSKAIKDSIIAIKLASKENTTNVKHLESTTLKLVKEAIKTVLYTYDKNYDKLKTDINKLNNKITTPPSVPKLKANYYPQSSVDTNIHLSTITAGTETKNLVFKLNDGTELDLNLSPLLNDYLEDTYIKNVIIRNNVLIFTYTNSRPDLTVNLDNMIFPKGKNTFIKSMELIGTKIRFIYNDSTPVQILDLSPFFKTFQKKLLPGKNINIVGNTISSTVPIAGANKVGGFMIGKSLIMDSSGKLSVKIGDSKSDIATIESVNALITSKTSDILNDSLEISSNYIDTEIAKIPRKKVFGPYLTYEDLTTSATNPYEGDVGLVGTVSDGYYEYILLKTGYWERIGNEKEYDLSIYITKVDADRALSIAMNMVVAKIRPKYLYGNGEVFYIGQTFYYVHSAFTPINDKDPNIGLHTWKMNTTQEDLDIILDLFQKVLTPGDNIEITEDNVIHSLDTFIKDIELQGSELTFKYNKREDDIKLDLSSIDRHITSGKVIDTDIIFKYNDGSSFAINVFDLANGTLPYIDTYINRGTLHPDYTLELNYNLESVKPVFISLREIVEASQDVKDNYITSGVLNGGTLILRSKISGIKDIHIDVSDLIQTQYDTYIERAEFYENSLYLIYNTSKDTYKIDLSSVIPTELAKYYTKLEIDVIIAQYYTRLEIDELLKFKQNNITPGSNINIGKGEVLGLNPNINIETIDVNSGYYFKGEEGHLAPVSTNANSGQYISVKKDGRYFLRDLPDPTFDTFIKLITLSDNKLKFKYNDKKDDLEIDLTQYVNPDFPFDVFIEGITLNGNVITLTYNDNRPSIEIDLTDIIPIIDLTPYYTKIEIDELLFNLDTKIDDEISDLEDKLTDMINTGDALTISDYIAKPIIIDAVYNTNDHILYNGFIRKYIGITPIIWIKDYTLIEPDWEIVGDDSETVKNLEAWTRKNFYDKPEIDDKLKTVLDFPIHDKEYLEGMPIFFEKDVHYALKDVLWDETVGLTDDWTNIELIADEGLEFIPGTKRLKTNLIQDQVVSSSDKTYSIDAIRAMVTAVKFPEEISIDDRIVGEVLDFGGHAPLTYNELSSTINNIKTHISTVLSSDTVLYLGCGLDLKQVFKIVGKLVIGTDKYNIAFGSDSNFEILIQHPDFVDDNFYVLGEYNKLTGILKISEETVLKDRTGELIHIEFNSDVNVKYNITQEFNLSIKYVFHSKTNTSIKLKSTITNIELLILNQSSNIECSVDHSGGSYLGGCDYSIISNTEFNLNIGTIFPGAINLEEGYIEIDCSSSPNLEIESIVLNNISFMPFDLISKGVIKLDGNYVIDTLRNGYEKRIYDLIAKEYPTLIINFSQCRTPRIFSSLLDGNGDSASEDNPFFKYMKVSTETAARLDILMSPSLDGEYFIDNFIMFRGTLYVCISDTIWLGLPGKDSWKIATKIEYIATRTNLGVIKIGKDLSISEDGSLSADIPMATNDEYGLVKIGKGLEIVDGVLESKITDEEEEINDLSGLFLDFGKMTPNTKADIRTKTHSKFFICAKADGKIFIGYNAFFNIEDVGYVFNSNSKNSWISKSNITHFNGILYLYNRGQVIGDYDKTTGYVTFSDEFIEYFDIRPSTYFMFYFRWSWTSYNVTYYPNEDNILSMSAATVLQHELKDCKFKVQGKSMGGNIVYQVRDDQYVLIEIVTRVRNNTRADVYLASDTNRKIGYVTIEDMIYTSIVSDYNNYNLVTFTLELEPLKLLNTNLIKTDGTTIIDLYDNPKHKQLYDKIILAYPECKIDRWRCRTPLIYSNESIVFKYDFEHFASGLTHTIEFKIKDDMKTCNVLVRMNGNLTEGYVSPRGGIDGLPFNPSILEQGDRDIKLLNISINNVTSTDRAELGEQNGKYTLARFKEWIQIQTSVHVNDDQTYNMYLNMSFENNTIPVEVKFDMTPIDPTLLFFENIVPMYKYLQLEQVATSGGRIGGGIIDETVVTSTTDNLKIVNLTNEEYQELLKNNTIDPDTIYHTTDDTSMTSTGFNYSLEEKYTGNRWIDGKKIYRRTFYIEIPVERLVVDPDFKDFTLINSINIKMVGNGIQSNIDDGNMFSYIGADEGLVFYTKPFYNNKPQYRTIEYTKGDE